MAYETSYDTGLSPFNNDKHRGKWSSPKDFLFACLGHAFKLDAVFIFPVVIFKDIGIYALIPYLLTLALCVLPIVFMQSFLGQFSSTGFLSVFRISPLFKGIGYVALAINLTTLTYYAVLGAVPLFYLFHTLAPTIPWSCEGVESWMNRSVRKSDSQSICLYINDNTTELKEYKTFGAIPSVDFFNYELDTLTMYHPEHPEGKFSWLLLFSTFLIWVMVAIIVVKPIEWIGKFLRYSCIAVLVIMGLLLIRLLFLPGIFHTFKILLQPNLILLDSFVYVPMVAFAALGPGWGSILTMASYNKFDTNIFLYSWLLCFAQMGIVIGLALMSMLVESFLTRRDPYHLEFDSPHSQWMEFLAIPFGLTYLEMPHVWSIAFFVMIILGCLNLLIVQIFSVMTSLFDEFEILRGLKREVTLGAIGVLALASVFFCSNYGITFFETIAQISIASQMILNFLLLVIVVWIYGRERLQRDVCFMTNRNYSTCMVNVIRYAAPLFIFVTAICALVFGSIHLEKVQRDLGFLFYLIIIVALSPWLFLPGYFIFKMLQTTGILAARIRRCIRPNDWYPVEPMDRRNYEDRFSETEASHNLTAENMRNVELH